MDFSPILNEHVCMESSDHWLQGAIQEECGGVVTNSSSSSSPRPPLMERKVIRPAPTEQALKCPRCESTNTKFCYYNNYSLSQPRYFCKTCRRYWTKGGTLRNIPVGGGCRKNKKVSSKKQQQQQNDVVFPDHNKDLQLITTADSNFPDHHPFPYPMGLMGNIIGDINNANVIDTDQMNYGHIQQNYNNLQGFGGGNMCYFEGYNGNNGGSYSTRESFYHHGINEDNVGGIINTEVKPNPKILSLEWQDNNNHQGCSGNFMSTPTSTLGSWTYNGMINGYHGPPTTNPLI